MSKKQIVVAYDLHRGIGADNDLLWKRDLPADLQRFKAVTTGTTVVMGRKTFESIGRPLPNRENIVISTAMSETEGVVVVRSLEEAYQRAANEVISIIGGAQVYEQALASADMILATEVQTEFPQAEVFFPKIDMAIWQEISREHHTADERNKYAFDFVTYEKRV